MSFSALPPEIWHMILNQTGIPLRERIQLRAVSPRFRDILQDGLGRETTLAIHVDVNYEKHLLEITPNDLIIKNNRFNSKFINFISRLIPQVSQLTLHSDSVVFWRKARKLVGVYAGQLEALKVDGYLSNTINREAVLTALAEVINSIATLRSLNFNMDSKSNVGYLLFHRLEFATLSRLNHFICTGDHFGDLMEDHPLFISTSLSRSCTHLQLDESSGVFIAQRSPNLTHLHLTDCWDAVLSNITPLQHLSSLALCFESYPTFDASFLQKLRPLYNLTDLHLMDISCVPLEPPTSKSDSLSHIKRLTLQIFPINNGGLFLRALSSWFPNLSECTIYCNPSFHKEIKSNLNGLPFTVKLMDESIDGKLTFWQ